LVVALVKWTTPSVQIVKYGTHMSLAFTPVLYAMATRTAFVTIPGMAYLSTM